MSRTRISVPGRALLAALLTVCWTALPAAPAARADVPVTLSRDGRISDQAGALGDRRGQMRSAVDRQYAYPVERGSRFTGAHLAAVARTAIGPALRENDRARAAIGAANGSWAVLADGPVPTSAVTPGVADPKTGGSGGTSTTDLILPGVLVGGAAVAAGYAYIRRRRRATTRTTPGAKGWGPAPTGPGGSPAPAPLPELDARAKEALVETDDAVRTSEEELGFAAAQSGEEATAPFTAAVGYAKGELAAAFRLRQQLDEASPVDDATRRRTLDEIIGRCTDAGSRLDAVSEDFDRLRALEREAPQALATAEAAFRALTGRVPAAEAALATMGEEYTESAFAAVFGDIEQAKDRLLFATSSLKRGRQSVDSTNHSAAAVYIRATESAVDQATTLVDAVERRRRELAEAAGRLPAALTETETDLADAGGLLEGTGEGAPMADLRDRIAHARSVLGDVRARMRAGPYDPIDALRRVQAADTALDTALAGVREREATDRRALSLLDGAVLTARSAVAAAADYVTTNRGAVGSQARTRLAEAQRLLERSRELAGSKDPQGALAEAQQADSLAGQARSLAEQDVRSYGNRNTPGGARGTGGGVGGAVLGGIILGGLLGGGGGRGGSVHGGGFGGRGHGGAAGPGSFGGGGTRGRRGGGGRF